MESRAARAAAAFDDLTEPVWEVCAGSQRVQVANAAARAAGVGLREGSGALPMPPDGRADAERALREVLLHGAPGRDLSWTLSGVPHTVELVRVTGDDGTVRGVLVQARTTSEAPRLHAVRPPGGDGRATEPEGNPSTAGTAPAPGPAAPPEPGSRSEHLAHHPAEVPMPDSLRLAVHRVDGGAAETTDWFDTLVLPGGRTALVVGSLPGTGPDAPVVVGALRAVLAEALFEGGPLDAAVRRADAAAARFVPGRGATLTAVVLDPPARTLEYVCRGHHPPVLDDGSRCAPLDDAAGGPLGLGAPPARPGRTTVSAGAALVLCTAGVVERPGQPGTTGLAELAASVRGSWRPTDSPAAADDLCARVLDRLRAHAPGVLMAVTVPSAAPVALHTEIGADPGEVVGLRERLEHWLRDVGVPADTLAAVPIVVCELVTNSVRHAYPRGSGGPIRVHAVRDHRCEVVVSVSDDGAWAPSRDSHGVGLAVARELSDVLTVDPGARGTTVRARFGLSRPVVTRERRTRLHVTGPGFGMLTAGDPATHLRVHGPVDPPAAQDLRSALLYATAGGTRAVTLDLAEVTVLGPAAVRVLHEFTGYADPAPPVRAPEGSVARAVLLRSGLANLVDDTPALEVDAAQLRRIR